LKGIFMISPNVEQRANGAARSMNDVAQNVSQRVEKFSHDAGERIGSMASQLQDGATEYVETGRDYIRQNPFQAAAYAACAGAAVGCLLTLALRSSKK